MLSTLGSRSFRMALWVLFLTSSAVAEDRAIAIPKPKPKPVISRRWAFLVGINDYVNYPKLRSCRQDCIALRDSLVEDARFAPSRIVMLTDDQQNRKNQPTYAQIFARLPQILEIAEPQDLVLVYLSGHGAQFEDNESKHGYFVPLDGESRQTCVPLSWLNDEMKACKARQKVLILDACRNDVEDNSGKAVQSLGHTIMAESTGTTFMTMFSCDAGQKSSEFDEANNGVFTHFLLEGLAGAADRDHDGTVDLNELHQYARESTQEWALQHGMRQSPILKGEIADPIVLSFVGPAASQPALADAIPIRTKSISTRPASESKTKPKQKKKSPAQSASNDQGSGSEETQGDADSSEEPEQHQSVPSHSGEDIKDHIIRGAIGGFGRRLFH